MITIRIQDAIRATSGNSDKIDLIKSLRHITEFGLKDAKDIMDQYCLGNPVDVEIDTTSQDRIDGMVKLMEKAGIVVIKKWPWNDAAKQMQTISGRLMAMAKEAIDTDMGPLASDLIEVYMKHFEA